MNPSYLRQCSAKDIWSSAALLMLLAGFAVPSRAQVQSLTPMTPGPVKLELRLGNGRTQFHRGEVIPAELIFSSTEHRKYYVSEDCTRRQSYHYHVPKEFVDRSIEIDAALERDDLGLGCHGASTEVDPGEQPFVVKQTLNSWFRMDTPGKYQISVTSNRMGFPIDSELVDIEILPSDPTWEQNELKRAIPLAAIRGAPGWEEGCNVLRYLGTEEAELQMARQEAGASRCNFDEALIGAKYRRVVLAELEKGLTDPDLGIGPNYLRTLAFVSLYEQHPEWYPDPSAALGEFQDPATRSGLWKQRGVPQAEELRYARVLAASLPTKALAARTICLETLIYTNGSMGSGEASSDIGLAIVKQIPNAFATLSDYARVSVLVNHWDEFKGPVIEPVLDDIVEGKHWLGPDGIALRRLYELSPTKARPVVLQILRATVPEQGMGAFPNYGNRDGIVQTLGILPDKELPELDTIMLQRLQSAQSEGAVEISAGLLQRYSSAALAGPLRPWFENKIGTMPCDAEGNLLAYFLRVTPTEGTQMLRRVVQVNQPNCLIMQRVARVRMSQEVEQVALAELDDVRPTIVEDALTVLQGYGSLAVREPLLRHFRQWHNTWSMRATELRSPAGGDQMKIENAYVFALGDAQAWLASNEDWQLFEGLCVTAACKEDTQKLRNPWGSPSFNYMIEILEPGPFQSGSDEFGYEVSPGTPGPRTMERLKEKMAQFPKGYVFKIDGRYRESHVIQQFYKDLQPWATEHGFELQLSN